MMLRRLKRDVETSLLPKVICKLLVDMTPLQLRLYKGILQRSDALHVSSMLSMSQLLATLSQLHKVVNHPKQILNFREKARLEEAKRIANNTYAGAVPTTQSLSHSHTLSLLPSQGSRVFAFLVCAEAGGMGINLASADSTIFAYIIYLN